MTGNAVLDTTSRRTVADAGREYPKLRCACTARLDRLQILAESAIGPKPPERLRGYKIVRDTFVRSQTTMKTYARCREYRDTTSSGRIFWQYVRQAGWLSHWKITIIADDCYGLSRRQIDPILRHCKSHRVLLAELALDFARGSRVTKQFVERYAIFGKSRPHSK
jgi:hypothetical protein